MRCGIFSADEHTRPLRPEPHRADPSRNRIDRAACMAFGPRAARRLHHARGRSRQASRGRRQCRWDPQRPPLARARLGRRSRHRRSARTVRAKRARTTLRRRIRQPSRRRVGLSVLLQPQGHPFRRERAAGAGGRSALPRDVSGAVAERGGAPPRVGNRSGLAIPNPSREHRSVHGSGARPLRGRPRIDRRFRGAPRGRRSGVPARGGCR